MKFLMDARIPELSCFAGSPAQYIVHSSHESGPDPDVDQRLQAQIKMPALCRAATIWGTA